MEEFLAGLTTSFCLDLAAEVSGLQRSWMTIKLHAELKAQGSEQGLGDSGSGEVLKPTT